MNTSATNTVAPRSSWHDIAKGIGIFLVVLGHTWRGLAEASIIPKDVIFYAFDNAIYAFHMPLFFFLSGWFFPKIVVRDSPKTLLKRVIWRLFYPMCLWTYIFISIKILAGGNANEPVGFQDLLRLPVPGYQHLWFLWALIVLLLGGIVLRPLFLRWLLPSLVSVTIVCLIMNYFGVFYENDFFRAPVTFSIYFLLGGICSVLGSLPKSGLAALAGVVVFGVADGIAISMQGAPGFILGTLIAVCAVLSVLSIIRYIDAKFSGSGVSGRILEIIALVGRLSLTIYMVHTIVSAMVRIVLVKLGFVSPPLHLVLGVSAGMIGPLLLHIPSIPVAVKAVTSGIAAPRSK